jgi:hypothetical protein
LNTREQRAQIDILITKINHNKMKVSAEFLLTNKFFCNIINLQVA